MFIFKFFLIAFLLFVLFVLLFGFSILRMLFRGLFGIKPKNRQPNQPFETNQKKHQPSASSVSKKIITSDEGEYVDYVEIKD